LSQIDDNFRHYFFSYRVYGLYPQRHPIKIGSPISHRFRTRTEKLYIAAVLVCYNTEIVALAMEDSIKKQLCILVKCFRHVQVFPDSVFKFAGIRTYSGTASPQFLPPYSPCYYSDSAAKNHTHGAGRRTIDEGLGGILSISHALLDGIKRDCIQTKSSDTVSVLCNLNSAYQFWIVFWDEKCAGAKHGNSPVALNTI